MACTTHSVLGPFTSRYPGQVPLYVYEITDVGEETESEELIGVYRNDTFFVPGMRNEFYLTSEVSGYGYGYGGGVDPRLKCRVCVEPRVIAGGEIICMRDLYYNTDEELYEFSNSPGSSWQKVFSENISPSFYALHGFQFPIPPTDCPCRDEAVEIIQWVNRVWLRGGSGAKYERPGTSGEHSIGFVGNNVQYQNLRTFNNGENPWTDGDAPPLGGCMEAPTTSQLTLDSSFSMCGIENSEPQYAGRLTLDFEIGSNLTSSTNQRYYRLRCRYAGHFPGSPTIDPLLRVPLTFVSSEVLKWSTAPSSDLCLWTYDGLETDLNSQSPVLIPIA